MVSTSILTLRNQTKISHKTSKCQRKCMYYDVKQSLSSELKDYLYNPVCQFHLLTYVINTREVKRIFCGLFMFLSERWVDWFNVCKCTVICSSWVRLMLKRRTVWFQYTYLVIWLGFHWPSVLFCDAALLLTVWKFLKCQDLYFFNICWAIFVSLL